MSSDPLFVLVGVFVASSRAMAFSYVALKFPDEAKIFTCETKDEVTAAIATIRVLVVVASFLIVFQLKRLERVCTCVVVQDGGESSPSAVQGPWPGHGMDRWHALLDSPLGLLVY